MTFASMQPRGGAVKIAGVLIHDLVFAPAPVTAVHDAMSRRGPALVRDAIAGIPRSRLLDLVGDLLDRDPRSAEAWPPPTLGEPRRHADRVLVPLVWSPPSANPLLWGFDGDLAYAPVGSRLTQLTLSGTAEVARIDTSGEVTAERVAQLAVRTLLAGLAAGVAGP